MPGGSAYRRPPVWRAVVRPARSFFARNVLQARLQVSCTGTHEGFKFPTMDGTQQIAIHQALMTVQRAVTTLTFPSCDQGDLFELIDRVEEELHSAHPNVSLVGTFLNSIARSLRAQPEAREVCLLIEDAIGAAGIASTWQSGI